MHLDGRTRSRLGTASSRLTRWLAVLFPFSIAGSVFGQSYLVPPQGFQGAPAVPAMGNVTPSGKSQMSRQTIQQINDAANGDAEKSASQPNGDITADAENASGASTTDKLLGWGATHVHLRLNYQFLYDAGLHSGPGVIESTFTQTLTPGISIAIGPHIEVNYSPSLRVYTANQFHDTLDHAFGITGGMHYSDWTLGLSGNLTRVDEPLLETSSQTEQTIYNAGLFASYSVSDKVSLTTTASANFLDVGGGGSTNVFVNVTNGPAALNDSKSYSASEWLDYKLNDAIAVGAGATLGYIDQQGGFRSVDEEFNGRLTWHPGPKINVLLVGGLDHQNFLGEKTTDVWNPIYSAYGSYQLFEQTSVSVYANRSVSASLFENQVLEGTDVGFGVTQRVLGKVNLSAGFGYTRSVYRTTTVANFSTSRTDDGTSFSLGVGFPFLKRCSFSAFYQYSQSHSTQDGYGHLSNQAGMALSWFY